MPPSAFSLPVGFVMPRVVYIQIKTLVKAPPSSLIKTELFSSFHFFCSSCSSGNSNYRWNWTAVRLGNQIFNYSAGDLYEKKNSFRRWEKKWFYEQHRTEMKDFEVIAKKCTGERERAVKTGMEFDQLRKPVFCRSMWYVWWTTLGSFKMTPNRLTRSQTKSTRCGEQSHEGKNPQTLPTFNELTEDTIALHVYDWGKFYGLCRSFILMLLPDSLSPPPHSTKTNKTCLNARPSNGGNRNETNKIHLITAAAEFRPALKKLWVIPWSTQNKGKWKLRLKWCLNL